MQRDNAGRRRKPSLKLRSEDERARDVAVVGWWPATVGAALVTVSIGWLLVVGLVLLAWFGLPGVPIGDALVAATQLFLVGHGVGAEWSGVPITLTPLGFVIIVCLLASGTAGFAAKQGLLAIPAAKTRERRRLALRTTVVFTIVYAAAIGILIGFFGSYGTPKQLPVILIAIAAACFLSASRSVGYRWVADLPTWARPIPRAVTLPLAGIFLTGFVHLLIVVSMNWGTLVKVHARYEIPWLAAALLIVVQLLYAPNFAIWLGSLQLGGGFTLGGDSLVGIGGSHVGLLPGVPILSGLANAPTTASAWWLLVGVLAGVAAGLLIWRSPYRLRIDETALVSTGSGIAVALLWLLLAWLSLGGLGVQRLTTLGPVMTQLAFTAIGVVGLSSMAAGVGFGLYQLSQQRRARAVGETGVQQAGALESGPGLSRTTPDAVDSNTAAETEPSKQPANETDTGRPDPKAMAHEGEAAADAMSDSHVQEHPLDAAESDVAPRGSARESDADETDPGGRPDGESPEETNWR